MHVRRMSVTIFNFLIFVGGGGERKKEGRKECTPIGRFVFFYCPFEETIAFLFMFTFLSYMCIYVYHN